MSCRDICLILKGPWSTSGHVAYTDLRPQQPGASVSLLEAMFGKYQDASLSDLIQGAIMLRYNKRQVG